MFLRLLIVIVSAYSIFFDNILSTDLNPSDQDWLSLTFNVYVLYVELLLDSWTEFSLSLSLNIDVIYEGIRAYSYISASPENFSFT